MSIWCPASFAELKDMLRAAVEKENGPAAIRYPRGGEGRYKDSFLADETILCAGDQLTMVCYGGMVNSMLDAADLLREQGISIELIKLNRILPNPLRRCMDSLKKTGRLLIAEDVCASGSVGQRLLAVCEKEGIPLKASALVDLGDGVAPQGKPEELYRLYGMHAEGLVSRALEILDRGEIK